MSWQHIHVGKENDRLTIDSVRIWQQEWRWIDARTIQLPDPLDPGHTLSHMVCEAGTARRPVRFAAGKLPSSLWSFYVPC